MEKRKVKNGKINLFGEKYSHEALAEFNNQEVELRSTGKGGFDIYWNDKYLCFLRTIPEEYLRKDDK